MKGPKGILAESIATALAEFFVVDPKLIETNLIQKAGITLNTVELKPQLISLNSRTTARITGSVKSVAFNWEWGQSKKEGGSDWIKDAKLTMSGLTFTAAVITSTEMDAPVNAPSDLNKPETATEQAKTKGFQAYVMDQVQRIVNTLTLSVTDFEFRLLLPDRRILVLGGSNLELLSHGRKDESEPLIQELTIGYLGSHILDHDDDDIIYPLLSPISYKAFCIRQSGAQRFTSGLERGLEVTGESSDQGVEVHVGRTQIKFFNDLGGMLLVTDGTATEPGLNVSGNIEQRPEKEQEEIEDSKDDTINLRSSYFKLPLSAISLIFPNRAKVSLSGLVARYQMDGSILEVEGRDGFLVNGSSFLSLGETCLWSANMVSSEFKVFDATETRADNDELVAFLHARENELRRVKEGLDEIFSVGQAVISNKSGAAAALSEKSIKQDKAQPTSAPWSFALEGSLGMLWEGPDNEIDAEAMVRNVTGSLGDMSMAVEAIKKFHVPGLLKLSQPIENTTLRFDGEVITLKMGSIVATLEEPLEDSVGKSSTTQSMEAMDPIEESTAFSESRPTASETTSLKESCESEVSFVMPFAVKASIESIVLLNPDENSANTIVLKPLLALGPDVPQAPEGQVGITDGIRIAFTMDELKNDMISLISPSLTTVVRVRDLRTLHYFDFNASAVAVAAGYSAFDWIHLTEVNGPRQRSVKEKAKKKIKEPSQPLKIPLAHVQPLKIKVVVSSDLVGIKDTTMHFEEFQGKPGTTSNDLVFFYSSRLVSQVPGMVTNAEVLGLNVADNVVSHYGSVYGASTMASLGVAGGAAGGVLGLAAFDGVRNAIKAGKKSRGVEDDDKWQLGDLARGLHYAALEATRDGAKRRGKAEEQQGDAIDWAVGATSDVASYANENKSRLGGAGAGAVGFSIGFGMGGPLGAIAGAVIASAVTGKTIDTVSNKLNKNAEQKLEQKQLKDSATATEKENELEAPKPAEEADAVETSQQNNPVPLRGILLKRRDFLVWDWRAHYFLLQDEELQYFQISDKPFQSDDEPETLDDSNVIYVDDDKGPRKSLKLPGLSVRADDALSKENLWVFTLHTPEQRDPLWVLAAGSEHTRNKWVQGLAKVCQNH
jgi:hypothetical protein